MEEEKHAMPQSVEADMPVTTGTSSGAGFENPVPGAIKNATSDAANNTVNNTYGTFDDRSMDEYPVDYRRVAYHGYGACSCCDERGE